MENKKENVIIFPFVARFNPNDPAATTSEDVAIHYVDQMLKLLHKHGYNTQDPEFTEDALLITSLLGAMLDRNVGNSNKMIASLDDLKLQYLDEVLDEEEYE